MNKYFRNIKGFSMVELSVVLTIIGITLAGAIDLATRKTESDRITETNARMNTIEEALKVFVIKNQRLPCPANASASLNVVNAGVEGTPTSAGCTMSSDTTTKGPNFNDGVNTYYGAVPTKTLGINDKNMADDWDRRFSYVVDYRFANNYATNPTCSSDKCFKQTTAGSMTVNDSTGVARTTEAVYILMSHGKNGYGAYIYTGSATRLAASTDTAEKENAGNDRTIAVAGFNSIFVQKDTTTTFDDIVRYKTKALIIDGISGVTDSTTCTAAYDNVTANVTATTTDPCIGLTGPAATVGTPLYNCNALATQINNLCLQP